MSDLNNCTFTGRLVRDAQAVQSGKMAFTSIAVGSFRKDGDDFIEETTFVEVKFLGEQAAKRAVENLKKGKAVWVTGELKQENREVDGKTIYRMVLIVSRFSLLPLNKREENSPTSKQPKEETKPVAEKSTKQEDLNIPF